MNSHLYLVAVSAGTAAASKPPPADGSVAAVTLVVVASATGDVVVVEIIKLASAACTLYRRHWRHGRTDGWMGGWWDGGEVRATRQTERGIVRLVECGLLMLLPGRGGG